VSDYFPCRFWGTKDDSCSRLIGEKMILIFQKNEKKLGGKKCKKEKKRSPVVGMALLI
jgi:hypothetical protein